MFFLLGGFSISAAKNGGITTTVDISSEAIDLARQNFRLNDLDLSGHDFKAMNVFDYLSETRETFDLIVLDPPAFVKKRNNITNGSRAYQEINRMAMKLLSSGGQLLTCSCSSYISWDLFQKILYSAARDAGREVRIVGRYGQPADHPVNIYHPEGEYLKSFSAIGGLICFCHIDIISILNLYFRFENENNCESKFINLTVCAI